MFKQLEYAKLTTPVENGDINLSYGGAVFKHLEYHKIDWQRLVDFAYERNLKIEFDIKYKNYYGDNDILNRVEPFDVIYLLDDEGVVQYYIDESELKDNQRLEIIKYK